MNNLKDNGIAGFVWYSGTVAHGLQNGRTFGYPTANLTDVTPPSELSPGVYAAKVRFNGSEYGAMLYVGTRPTLGLTESTLEIHLFDFDGDLYGTSLAFALLGKIREERNFSTVAALVAQIRRDEAGIREMLATAKSTVIPDQRK